MFAAKEAKRFKLKAGAMFVLRKGNEVLLSRRFNTGIDDGWYVCPMGGVEEGEMPKEALCREMEEELGIAIDPKDLRLLHVMYRLHPLKDGGTFTQADFFFTAETYQGVVVNQEPDKCDELRFYPIEKLPPNVVPSIKVALDHIREGRFYSEFGWTEEEIAYAQTTHKEGVMDNTIYDSSYVNYDRYRRADPAITQKLLTLFSPQTSGKYLDMGCGSGNYTIALKKGGLNIEGIDLSPKMLSLANAKAPEMVWKEGDLLKLPYGNTLFDGALTMNTLHYFRPSFPQLFREMRRVLKPGSKLLLFAVSIEQCAQYWACQYFPYALKLGYQVLPRKDELLKLIAEAGFEDVKSEPFFATKETEDLFFYSCKYRPHLYLDAAIRAGMSPLQLMEYSREIEAGCAQLKEDIESKRIDRIIEKHESQLGEALYIQAIAK
jgi:ubiquinone/menaquinone biosynthesis C-methylase UbiE/8-oxo-dGTP pyrophosphatase MutT (NUDIX family)